MRNENLIKTLYDCAAACNYCADACLDEDNVKMMVRCIRLDKICAETCIATAKALAVNAPNDDLKGLVKYCMEICRKCGDECAQHKTDHCKRCAEACKRCEEACKNFA